MKMIWNDDKISLNIETPNGKKILLDDDAGCILIEDENSNKVEFNSTGITYQSEGDIVIKATGDLKLEGLNVAVKGQMEMKAEAGMEAKLIGGVQAKIEAAIVQIN